MHSVCAEPPIALTAIAELWAMGSNSCLACRAQAHRKRHAHACEHTEPELLVNAHAYVCTNSRCPHGTELAGTQSERRVNSATLIIMAVYLLKHTNSNQL